MNTQLDCQRFADLLEVVPEISTCTRNVIEEFVRTSVVKVRCGAGQTLSVQTQLDLNLYVVTAGSAVLDAGEGVVVKLEAGDYFGGNTRWRHFTAATVVAESDIEVLIINPQEIARLRMASSRDRHPSGVDWRVDLPSTVRRAARRNHRRAVLASQGM